MDFKLNKNLVVIEVEDYKGNTLQGFKLNISENNEIGIEDVFLKDSEYKSLSDFGIKVDISNERAVLCSDKYSVADIDEDYLFDSDCDLIRIQENEIDWENISKYKYSKEMEYKGEYIKMLDFSEYFIAWYETIRKTNAGLFNNIDINSLEKFLCEEKDIKTCEFVMSHCINYYAFDKKGNVYKMYCGWDEQCMENFDRIEVKYSPKEAIEHYKLIMRIKENELKKKSIIEKRESNKDLEWLKKEILEIIKENTFEDSSWKDKEINEVQITVCMEDADYVEDVILIDVDNKKYYANRDLYEKLESLYQVFYYDLFDIEVFENLNNGFKLTA